MQKVIIDCDPGIDDVLALEYALRSPELDVVAITVVAGNVPVDLGVENTFKVLERCNRLDVPVYAGADKPLKKPFVSAQDTHGEDGLGESGIVRTSAVTPQDQVAYQFLRQYFATSQDTGIIALGPLTNIALALEKDNTWSQNIQRFVTMGGTYKSHGNCSPVAEFNYWCDPDAAAIVYQKLAVKIEMVGLDVTRKIVLTPNILEYTKRINPESFAYLQKITRFYFDFHWQYEHILGCVINDPLAVAYYIDPTLCLGFDSYVAVETCGLSLGQTLVDRYDFWQKEPNAKILDTVDSRKFFEMFLTVILNAPEALIASDLKNLRLG